MTVLAQALHQRRLARLPRPLHENDGCVRQSREHLWSDVAILHGRTLLEVTGANQPLRG